MLKSALKRAVQERLIPFNPAEFCIPPKITKPELQVIPSERYQSYLTAAERRGVLPMFYLELATGLRKGEIAALLWSDFDAQTKTIHVNKAIPVLYNGQGTVSPPKSSTSVRYVSISEEAAKLLEQEHEKHPKKSLHVSFPGNRRNVSPGRHREDPPQDLQGHWIGARQIS